MPSMPTMATGRMTSRSASSPAPRQSGTWAETTYSDFAANGEPQTIVHKEVVRSYGGAPPI